jgi:hypothetical protein
MSESIRRNFEPGRWLLVSGVMLSVVLMLQLYAINETVDISSIDSIIGDNYMGLLLIASYLLTTVSMVTVVVEYFSVRKKVDGLLALTEVLNVIEDLQYPVRPIDVEGDDAQLTRHQAQDLDNDFFEPEPLKEVSAMSPLEQAYAALDDGERVSEEAPEAVASGDNEYKTLEVKLMEDDVDGSDDYEEASEPEPLPEVDVSEGPAEQEEDVEIQVEGMLQESEVISTLSELERVVDELRIKKPKIAAT